MVASYSRQHRAALFVLFLAMGGMLVACGTTEDGGGPGTVSETFYLSCEVDEAACGAGAVSCQAEGGDEACVTLPDECEGVLGCDCLADEVCGAKSCREGADGTSISCDDPVTTYDPCDGKACGDECDPCEPGDDQCAATPGAPRACDDAGACVVAPVECGGDEIDCAGSPSSFPELGGSCAEDTDCVAVLHQIDCCGTSAVLGIPASRLDAFETAESTCQAQYPGCGCPTRPPTADDGRSSWSLDDFTAVCEGGACKSVAKEPGCSGPDDCGGDYFCDFAGDDCGVWGGTGTCTAKPEECDMGGTGACDCSGQYHLNDCGAHTMGSDVLRFGGCDMGSAGTFTCGTEECAVGTEICSIAFNDVAGPDEPEYYDSCAPLPTTCQGASLPTCECVEIDQWSSCWDAGGVIIVFYPGG